MTYKLTLDGTQYQPINWQQTTLSGAWEDEFWSVTGNFSLDFRGEAYAYLRGLFDVGYCVTVEVKIYLNDHLVHEGFIYVSEVEWDLVKCVCNVSISDNGYLAIIDNKRNQEYFLFGGRDSSNQVITKPSTVAVDFHDVTDGSSLGDRACYHIFDVMDYLITAMTDSEIGFVSDFLSNLELYLTRGQQIRAPTPSSQNIQVSLSYDDLWPALQKIYNLQGTLEGRGLNRRVRIEPYDYWRGVSVGPQFNNLSNLKESVDSERIYSAIDSGSSRYRQSTDDTPNTSYPNTGLVTWDDGSYPIIGSCVNRSTLNLKVSNFIIDSNSIENQLNGNADNDRDLFLIETEITGYGIETAQYDTLGNGLSYYNQGLNNQTIIGRWSNRIHNNTLFNNGQLFGDFEAGVGVETALWDFVVNTWFLPYFDNVISDPGGNYNPAFITGTYTTPSAGTYIFEVELDVEVTWIGLSPPEVVIDTGIETGGAVPLQLRETPLQNPNTSAEQTSTIRYSWIHTFGSVSPASYQVWTFNAARVPIVGKYLTSSRFRSSTTLAASSIPLTRSSEFPLCLADFREMQDIKKIIAMSGQQGHINSFDYRPFGGSNVQMKYIR